jgi:2'-5' RNA ligase
MNIRNIEISKLYDGMWQAALARFAQGQVEPDGYLANRQSDRRLGVTVIARPSQRVVDQYMGLISQLQQVEPDQYYYQPDQLHITILSLFTATENSKPYFSKLADYLAVSGAILPTVGSFAIDFQGVTATPNGIMGQGFPQDGYLEALREKLRKALRERDLGEGLDTRYRLSTAHVTLMRFRYPPRALSRLVDILKEHRDFRFGDSLIQSLQMVKNDWYMSTEKVEVLAEYELS